MIGFHKLLLDRLAPFAYEDQVTPHLATFHATLVRIGLRVREIGLQIHASCKYLLTYFEHAIKKKDLYSIFVIFMFFYE